MNKNNITTYSTPFTNDPGFILHDSFLHTFLRIWEREGAEIACRYIKALGLYGLSQDEPDEDDPIWIYGLCSAFFMMDVDAGRAEL